MKAAASGRAVQHLAARRGTRRCMVLALAGAFGAPAWALDDAPAAPAAVVASEDDGAVLQRQHDSEQGAGQQLAGLDIGRTGVHFSFVSMVFDGSGNRQARQILVGIAARLPFQ